MPGDVELPNGTSMIIDVEGDEVSVNLEGLWLDAESLRAAAELMTRFAEVLEENEMKEAA